jgi:general stress protein 26
MINTDNPAVVDILRRAMVARIATVSRNGRPHINPLYFVHRDGTIYLGTSDRTLAARNVKVNPRVTLLFSVESEPKDHRVLRIRGCATVRTDPKLCRWYRQHDLLKYIITWHGLANTLAHARLLPIVRRYIWSGAKGQPCVLEVQTGEAEFLTVPKQIAGQEVS